MSRLREIQVPRGAVAILCALVLVPPASMALGHSLWMSGGQWVHHHTKTYTGCYDLDSSSLLTAASEAKTQWSGASDELYLPTQSNCHPNDETPAHVQLVDGSFGNTGWLASSVNDSNPANNAARHAAHTHINFNLTYLNDNSLNYTSYDKRAVVCRELGQVVGVARVPSGQWAAHGANNDCMSFGGVTANQVSQAENSSNYTYTDAAGEHSADLVDNTYREHEPDINLLASDFKTAYDAGIPLTAQSYAFSVEARDRSATGSDAGVTGIEVFWNDPDVLDDPWQSIGSKVQGCSAPGSCVVTLSEPLATDDYAEGVNTFRVVATDALGLTVEEEFAVTIERDGSFTAASGRRAAYTGCITGEVESGPGGSGACSLTPVGRPGGVNSGLGELTSGVTSLDARSVYAVAMNDDAIVRFDRNTQTGALTYGGCITGKSQAGSAGSGACSQVPRASSLGSNSGLDFAHALAISADGASVYVAAPVDDAIARFDRNTQTGALTYGGCITGETQSGPAGTNACAQVPSATSGGSNSGLDLLGSIAVSPDGTSVYSVAGGDDAIARFDRNTQTGALTYGGCITGETQSGPAGTNACAQVPSGKSGGVNSGLDSLAWINISPDGTSVYAISEADDAVVSFHRNPQTAALTYGGCTTGETQSGPTGSSACDQIPSAQPNGTSSGIDSLTSVATSPDGISVYATSTNDDSVANFEREPNTGDLRYVGCLTGEMDTGHLGPAGEEVEVVCDEVSSATQNGENSGLDSLRSVTVSPDGAPLYAVSGEDDALATFDRAGRSGELEYVGCISGDQASGPAGSDACDEVSTATSDGNGSGLNVLQSVAVSPDGDSVYGISTEDDGIATFGAEKRESPPATGFSYTGCVTGDQATGPDGSGACRAVPAASSLDFGDDSGLGLLRSIAISPDGTSAYAAASDDDGIASFDAGSDPAPQYTRCTTGESESGPSGSDACDAASSASSGGVSSGLESLTSVAVSPDGNTIYGAAPGDDAIARFDRDPSTGYATYEDCLSGNTASGPSGSAACSEIAEPTSNGEDSGLDELSSVTISSDGGSVYGTSVGDDAIMQFDRDLTTGQLGYVGCISGELATVASPDCDAIPSTTAGGEDSGLDYLVLAAVSPDDEYLYATSVNDHALVRFARDSSTGDLTYLGCFTGEVGTGQVGVGPHCAEIPSATSTGAHSGLHHVDAVTVSPDGETVYTVSPNDDAIASFGVTQGGLEYLGCLSGDTATGPGGSGACAQISGATRHGEDSGLDGLEGADVSPDGSTLLAVSAADSAVVLFDRAASSGELTFGGCLTGEIESGPGNSGACETIASATPSGGFSGLSGLESIEFSPDGGVAYTASPLDAAVARLDVTSIP